MEKLGKVKTWAAEFRTYYSDPDPHVLVKLQIRDYK